MSASSEDGAALQQFCLLAKSAKGAGCASLIGQALEHPGIFVFGELLDMPSIKELAGTAAAPHLELLKLFAWGTWTDYKSRAAQLPALSEAQASKAASAVTATLAPALSTTTTITPSAVTAVTAAISAASLTTTTLASTTLVSSDDGGAAEGGGRPSAPTPPRERSAYRLVPLTRAATHISGTSASAYSSRARPRPRRPRWTWTRSTASLAGCSHPQAGWAAKCGSPSPPTLWATLVRAYVENKAGTTCQPEHSCPFAEAGRGWRPPLCLV